MFKTIFPLTLIISLRFLGLFIVLPVLSVYALHLEGSSEFLVGITIGGYAITQMFLQIPFGILSDKIGRKITIFIGLVIFMIGSLVCGFSENIYGLMIGRFLQGAGAIGAVGTAMISDMVKEEVRAKAMAIMGGSIAASFAISMMLGSLIGGYYGVDKLFFITAALSVFAIIVLYTKVPNPPKIVHHYGADEAELKHIFKDTNLMKMNITNLLQKGMMTLAFMVIPIIMFKEFGFEKKELWMVYLPAMICGVLAMGPSAILGEKKHKAKEMLMIGIVLFGTSYVMMGYAKSAPWFIVGVVLFFIGFNMHEPLMQSMASKYAKIHQKGAALGVFNSFGYAGTFIGGVFGGLFLQHFGIMEIAWVIFIACILWLFLIASLKNPSINKNLYLPFETIDLTRMLHLSHVKGVVEWYKNESEQLLVVKYDSELTDKETILAVLE
ncbi:MFS transporter [Sulfurospirillum barnesii]|uniref:Arabinose efflux permease family protein n=1 Tax=Sulfurospirillum barnesii (strain ATCC 700032 / DSM 10660 / SES-3) TaxID=760154 RepID=I3Y041_SULBS|nr:MFS transporter [Sulfurospirillum barnesii]AFL69565.1 arabinose efflux permease family protein [Sulfurospirillum barnesii SES-3]